MAVVASLGLPGWTQEEASASLTLATTPDKAMVTCDGLLREETPVTLSGLKAGQHLVLFEKAGYLPARRTVSLTAGQRSSLVVPLERLTGLVLIQSIPDGADLEINGAHRGKAPLLTTDLSPGRYRMKASAEGYLSRDVEFEVVNRIPQKVVVSLASDSATLTVHSQPGGAAVKVNGLTKGVTPCTLDRLPAGANEVTLSLSDYDVYRTVVKLQANSEQSLEVTLKAIPAILSVISTPGGARFFVDDILKGQTPLTLDGMAAGSHAVRAEMDGYDSESRTVELKPAEKTVTEFSLVRNIGRVEITAKPDGILVKVDGAEKGIVSSSSDNPVGKLGFDIPVGDHKIVLSLKGYSPVEKLVTIQKGGTLAIKEVLKRVFTADTLVKLSTGEMISGVLCERLPNDDIKLETQLGIYKTIKAADVLTLEPLKSGNKK